MTRRKIIRIDESLCAGRGACETGCAEGALKVVDGKAKLVKEQFCDGFGDCIGTCPTGALQIEERDCDEFDLAATSRHLRKTQGEAAVRRMEEANRRHAHAGQEPAVMPCGCPGTLARTLKPSGAPPVPTGGAALPPRVNASELSQWPVQLHLVQPGAPFFEGHELAVLSTCSPIASADAHWRFLRERAVVVACPRLNRTEGYADKLAQILAQAGTPRVIVVRMEVPCCGGLTAIVERAAELSGRTDLAVDEVTVGLNGDVVREAAMREP
jgi:NAD-dependent dihydropyrimidine dehydrogenase PreA subunit